MFPMFDSFFILILINMQMRSNRPKTSVKLSNGITGLKTMCNDDSLCLQVVFMGF